MQFSLIFNGKNALSTCLRRSELTMFYTNNPFDVLLYFCQIVDNFYKNYPVAVLENVLSFTIKTFAHPMSIFCKQH